MACTGSGTSAILPPSSRHLATATLRAGGSSPLLSDDVENDIMAPLPVGFDIESLEHRHYKDTHIVGHNHRYMASVEPKAVSSTRSRASTSFRSPTPAPNSSARPYFRSLTQQVSAFRAREIEAVATHLQCRPASLLTITGQRGVATNHDACIVAEALFSTC